MDNHEPSRAPRAHDVRPRRLGSAGQVAVALLVALAVTAFGVHAVQARRTDLATTWALLPGMPGALWWYAWRWPPEILGWLVLAWAATRRLASTGSRAVHVPLLLGIALVAVSVVASHLDGPSLAWAGPVGPVAGSWWGAAGPLVVSAALLVACWLARHGAEPSPAPSARTVAEAGGLVAIPLLSLAFGAVALTASALGVRDALVVSGVPYVLVVLAALAASGGGRTSTAAVLGGVLLVTNLSLVWRPAAYLTIFAAGCALALVPTARGIEWLTAPRSPIPTFDGPSVPERADADDRARA